MKALTPFTFVLRTWLFKEMRAPLLVLLLALFNIGLRSEESYKNSFGAQQEIYDLKEIHTSASLLLNEPSSFLSSPSHNQSTI